MTTILLIAILFNFVGLQAETKYCEGGPLPRLHVGGQGEVAPEIDRLWLRALPAVGTGEVRVLYAGNQFEVIGGPSCNGGYHWWRVQMDTGETGWVAEGLWEAYYLRPVIADDRRKICERAETPWLHVLVTAACSVAKGMVLVG